MNLTWGTSAAAASWFVGLCALAYLGLIRWDVAVLETDFLSLLPVPTRDSLVAAASERLAASAERRVIWLLGGDAAPEIGERSDELRSMLQASGLFEPFDDLEETQRRFARLFDYRFQLLGEEVRDQLATRPAALSEQALAALFGPTGGFRLRLLAEDPLGLFERYLTQFRPPGVELFEGRIPMVRRGGATFAVIAATVSSQAFDLDAQERLAQLVAESRRWAESHGNTVWVTGIPLYVAHGSSTAKREISTVGFGSLVVVVGIFLITFRAIRPLLLAGVAIGVGLLLGYVATTAAFGRIHIMTLVFGATLIGVSVDYAVHYLCDGFRQGWSVHSGLRRILPGITFGLMTSVAAYTSLSVAPFPGLRQIAVFSAAGLVGAWLTVVLLFPALMPAAGWRHQPGLMRLSQGYARRFPRLRDGQAVAAAVICCAALGLLLMLVEPNDDVRALRTVAPELQADAEWIATATAQQRDTQFLLLEGPDVPGVLHAERVTRVELDRLVDSGRLNEYWALSRGYRDLEAQRAAYRQLNESQYDSGRVESLYATLNASSATVSAHLAEFASAQSRSISLADWLDIVGTPWRDLWMGCDEARCASMITLNGARGLEARDIAALQHDGVRYVDPVATISNTLARYRVLATQLLAVAYLIIAALLCLRFGLSGGFRVLLVPLASVVTTLALLEAAGAALNLFTVFALVIVVGIGFDYAIFFRLHGRDSGSTALAVMLSWLTTMLAFGLLSVSSTPVVRTFGVTLALGLSCAYLLAPIAAVPSPPEPREKR